jgi:DNA-binding MarR family transcriptional regulator
MLYTHVLGRPPAEADLQRHFGVSPPSVHQMVLTLERTRLIRRKPGVARSIEVLVAPGPTLSRSKLIKLRAELLPTEATSNKVSPPEYDRYLWVV